MATQFKKDDTTFVEDVFFWLAVVFLSIFFIYYLQGIFLTNWLVAGLIL